MEPAGQPTELKIAHPNGDGWDNSDNRKDDAMKRISPAKAALSVGLVLGLYHLSWIALVALGVARPVLDFVLKLHFIQMTYDVAPFSVSTAASLVVLTFAIGAALGLIFALVWNWLMNSPATQAREAPFPRTAR